MSEFQQLSSPGLRVEFTRVLDRIGHRVLVAVGDGWREVLNSIEGTSEQDWPASPPLKDLHFEPRDGGVQLALLVGMAGKSHWSASLELNPQAEQLTFDMACRVRVLPEWLGNSYQLPVAQPATMDGGLKLAEGWWLHGETEGGLLAPHFTTPDGGSRWLLHPPEITAPKFPQTIRWRYSLGVLSQIHD